MTTGRDLPPLLPLEYCRIDRAARLLQCEVEDIIHWGIIGSIKLGVRVQVEGYLSLHPSYAKELDFTDAKALVRSLHCLDLSLLGHFSSVEWLSDNEMEQFAETYIKQREHILSKGYTTIWEALDGMTGDEDPPPSFSLLYDSDGTTQLEDSAIPVMRIPCVSAGIWLISFNGDAYLDFENKGFVELSPYEIDHGEHDPFTVPVTYTPVYEEPELWDMGIDFFTKEASTYQKNDLIILRADLLKLHHSITTGEPLLNVYNNAELAQMAKKREAMAPRSVEPRVTTKQSDLISALIDLHFTQEGRRLGDMGHQSFFNEVLAPALATAGIACPTTDRSFDDWIKKSRKFSK